MTIGLIAVVLTSFAVWLGLPWLLGLALIAVLAMAKPQ